MVKHLLSIITPVYNVASYLDRCVLSILAQSYHDIELILVDDGSTDGSSVICDKWTSEDSRVIVIHKENGGVSSARNAGLEVVKGEYLTFVDPDDFIAPETYEANMAYLLDHREVDILQYPYCNYVNDNETPQYHKPIATLIKGSEQIFKNWWSGSPLEYVIWNKIYKFHLWSDIHFNEGHISEDTCLVPKFVNVAKIVYISEKGLYYYQRDRIESYTFGKYDFNKHLDLFYAHATIYECFKQFPDMVTEKVQAFTRLYRRLISAKETDPTADINEPKKLIVKNFPSWREIIASHHTEKLWLSLAKILGTNLFILLFLRYLKS
jgi:glycosyltransferase involved in cell wall biosynthesis